MKFIARVFPAALAAVAAIMLPARPAARQTHQTGPAQSFQSAVSLVALNVTVQGGKAQYVDGLRPEDFVVYEDGIKQDVRFFEAASLPIDLIVLLDTSRSMSDKLKIAQRAARGFLETLRSGDRGAVITFNHTVTVQVPLTSDRDALDEAVDSTVADGNTALHTALYIALKQFGMSVRTDGGVRRQAIAVLSDGEDTASLVSFDDVLELARQTGVNVYTVRVQPKNVIRDTDPRMQRAASQAEYELKALARETGALSFFPQPEQLNGVYATIAKELASQYSIGYEPSRGGSDGRFRRVQVQVVSRPELRARTRAGYTAESAHATTVR